MIRNANPATANPTGASVTDTDTDATSSRDGADLRSSRGLAGSKTAGKPAHETGASSDPHRRDRDAVEQTHRTTTEEARRSAGATEGIGEPTMSHEANEPTTAAADRLRFLREGQSEP